MTPPTNPAKFYVITDNRFKVIMVFAIGKKNNAITFIEEISEDTGLRFFFHECSSLIQPGTGEFYSSSIHYVYENGGAV